METYRSAFTKDKLMTGDVAVVAGQYVKIGEYIVQAGEMIQLGYGTNDSQEGASGRIYVDVKNNAVAPGANLEGIVRFTVLTPQRRPLRILGEFRTETLRTDKTNRTLQVPFPSNGMPFVSEDKILVVEFVPDASGTVGKTNTTILFDITQAVI